MAHNICWRDFLIFWHEWQMAMTPRKVPYNNLCQDDLRRKKVNQSMYEQYRRYWTGFFGNPQNPSKKERFSFATPTFFGQDSLSSFRIRQKKAISLSKIDVFGQGSWWIKEGISGLKPRHEFLLISFLVYPFMSLSFTVGLPQTIVPRHGFREPI